MTSGVCRVAVLAFAFAACRDNGPCTRPPCPYSAFSDLEVSVLGGTPQAALANAFVVITAPGARDSVPCGFRCDISRGTGTYELDVGAPGYATKHQSVAVTENVAPRCGCGKAQQIDVVLAPAR